MRWTRSLRFRVAASFAVLGAVVSVLLSMALYVAGQELERRLIAESLADEIDEYATLRRLDPSTSPIATRTIRSYVRAAGSRSNLPVMLRDLQPGIHEVILDGQKYYAAVEDRNSQRFYMLYNQVRLEPRARELAAFLAVAVAGTTLAAAGVGLWLARRVVAPVSELAQRVGGLQPEERPRRRVRPVPSDEVGELTRAFDRYRDRLAAFIEREHSFTADVSHELRTSLTVINGATELLLNRESLPDDARHVVERIARSVREMSEVTEALLALAREPHADPAQRTSCEMNEVLGEVIADHRHLLAGKPIALEVFQDEPVALRVERSLVRIVIGNLIRNAFSYTEEGLIRVRLDGHGLSIEDSGPGIERDMSARVFDRYYRGRGGAGTGIGLALVKRVCDRHGWVVSVRSDNGAGTVTRVRFAARDGS